MFLEQLIVSTEEMKHGLILLFQDMTSIQTSFQSSHSHFNKLLMILKVIKLALCSGWQESDETTWEANAEDVVHMWRGAL